MQANLVIKSTDGSGKKITTTVTHLRPSQKEHATALATALNALTGNIYESASVNELNVDIGGKTEPTLTIGTWQQGSGEMFTQVNYNGDGQLFVQCSAPAYIYDTTYKRLEVKTTGSFSGTIYATETDNYASKTLNFNY